MITIHRERFFDGYRSIHGSLNQSQVEGLSAILRAAERDHELELWHRLRDVGALAYILATAWWESARAFRPVREGGRGRGRRYGVPVRVAVPLPGSAEEPVQLDRDEDAPLGWSVIEHVYYGRGLVQITWFANYLHMGRELSIGPKLALDPDLALDPTIAYRLLATGVVRGCYAGHRHTLAEFVPPKGERDFLNARRLVNGLDRAEEIAEEAAALEEVLEAALEAAD